MGDSKSSATSNDDDDHFFDALDEFPFYDCIDADEISFSSSIDSKPSPEPLSPAFLRRRRPLYQRRRQDNSGSDSKDSVPTSSVSSETNLISETLSPRGRKFSFPRNFKEIEAENEIFDSFKGRFSSGRANNCINDEIKENSTTKNATGEKVDESVGFDSIPAENDDSSSNFLFSLAGFVIKAIGFQINLLVSFLTFPIWLLYSSYMFLIDPFRVVRRGKEYVMGKLLRTFCVVYETATTFMYEWFKEHKSIWKMALRCGWGLLWSAYVYFILVALLFSSFVISGLMMKYLAEEPIQMEETLNFDYTKDSPVAFVPIISCPLVSCGANCGEKIETGKLEGPRVIPANRKLQLMVSLTLPESDYNRNLGMFQVRVDFLSVNSKTIASSSHPCMLRFKSQPLHLLLTFLKIAPLLAGYSSESQTLDVKFRGLTEGDLPTACLRVIIEQRAEYRPGAGIPEIYTASLSLESELPLLKRIIWCWKKTIFVWISMVLFTTQLLFTLLCCKPIVLPRARRRDGSASNSAPQNSNPVRRETRLLRI